MTNQYEAGVKDYRLTYWEPEYQPKDTDLLAVFKAVPQPGVPREEVAAAVAAESSTGTWTTVWTDLLTDLDHYRGRAYRIEDVPGDPEAFYAYVAYPLDLFEEGSVVNVLTSLVGNVFGFKALRSLRLEDTRFPLRNRIIAMLCRAVIVVEAAVTGGALITATKAMEYGINVFAVPGDVDRESSVGCNLLTRDGAHPVLGSDDLVEELSLILGPPAVISAKNE